MNMVPADTTGFVILHRLPFGSPDPAFAYEP